MATAFDNISEKNFQKVVVEMAQRMGWIVAHFGVAYTPSGHALTPTRYDAEGFPDLVLVHQTRGVLFRELKSQRGLIRAAQEVWIRTLQAAGANADIWRPSDIQRIDRELREKKEASTSQPSHSQQH